MVMPFRVALLGTGTAAKEHAKGWLLAGAKLVATVGPQAPNGQLRRLISNVPHYRDLSSLRVRAIDAVDICTPHHLHFQQMLEMNDWPISILVEKPLVTTIGDLTCLKRVLSERRYPILMRTNKRFEHHIREFFAFVRTASDPLAGRISWYQNPQYMSKRRWYRNRVISGGGVVLGMGIHYMDLLAELSTHAVVRDATIRIYRCPPNARDTTSENYAKALISLPQIETELILSGWRMKSGLPRECIQVLKAGRCFRFEREGVRDAETELVAEFGYYRDVISRGEFHPRKDIMVKAHQLALDIYEKAF